MRIFLFIIIPCWWIALISGCESTQKHHLFVDTVPTDALVSVCSAQQEKEASIKGIAGSTPLDKDFVFEKDKQIWLAFEKRGYETTRVSVGPNSGKVSATLKARMDDQGAPMQVYTFPEIRRILVAEPDFKVIQRGFSSETVSEEQSNIAEESLFKGVERFFKERYEVVPLAGSSDQRRFRTLWRDVHTSIQIVDPIRLKYQPEPLLMETKGSRSAADYFGRKYDGDVMIFLCGKQNKETGGMLAGKIGMTAIGTANSYTAGYSRAMARGDSYFVYNIYAPQFAEGVMINAVMVDCRTGEIVWANKGGWAPFDFDNTEAIDQVLTDLFFGLN